MALEGSTELLGEFFGAEVLGYSVLQITVAAVGVAAVIGGLRWAYRKALS